MQERAEASGSPEQSPAQGERVAVGRINTTWGLRGHVKVTPFTSNPDRFAPGATLLINGRPTRVVDLNTSQGYPIVKFEGYPDATAASALRGATIEIDERDLPALPEGEHYVHDLVGLEVVDEDGETIGTLQEVTTTGANDVYVIRRPGQRDVLIPAIPDVILSVDLGERRMTVHRMPGLFD
jgi:16S rRNA processing protein RimM